MCSTMMRLCRALPCALWCLVVFPAMAAEPASQPAANANSPLIQPAEPIHDFGVTWASGPIQYSFAIKNAGKAALEISRIQPACGCTTVGEYPKRLEPGQVGQFAFTLDSQKLYGQFSKLISIFSNDPRTPELKLTLKGECKHYVEIMPYTGAAFGKINGSDPTSRMVTLKNNTEGPMKLILGPSETKKFKYELVEKDQGKLFELHVTTIPPNAPGMLTDKVTLTTNIDQQKTVTVDVFALVPERFEVVPNVININTSAATASKTNTTQTLTFTNNGEPPAKILEALVDDPAIKVGLEEQDPGKRYGISVLIPPRYIPPATGRTVVIRIDDPEKPFLLIPIRSMAAATPPTSQPAIAKKPDLVGKPAPEFKLTTMKGVALNKAQSTGKVTVLNFFAPNCGFCKKQIPRLETLRPAYEAKGVQFVLVSETMGQKVYTKEEISSVLGDIKTEADWAIDQGNLIGNSFYATGFPTMVVINQSGKVEAINVGNMADLETVVKSQLDQLLAQTNASKAARPVKQ